MPLFALLTLWLAGLACWRPLANPDEGRYTDVARWMLRSGDWLIPRLNGLPFLHKPPLYYWLEASVMSLGGPSLLAARAASCLGALMICGCAYVLARRWHDEATARWSVILLASNPLLALGAQYANLDMLVAGCISATITLAALAAYAPDGKGRAYWWSAYAMAGLGVLAKGLIGIVLPGAVFVAWLLMLGQWRRLGRAFSVIGILVLLAVTLPWFVLGDQAVPGLVHFVIVVQHFQRYTQTGFNNAVGPWFYPAILLAGMLPWSLVMWPGLRSAWGAAKLTPAPATDTPKAQADQAPSSSQGSRPLIVLAACWLLVILVFFSIPRSKIVGYILPVAPALALLLAPWVARWKQRHALAATGAALCIGLVVALVIKQPHQAAEQLARALRTQIQPSDVVVMWDRYDYAVPVVLDRAQPVWVVGDWSTSGHDMPDNWRRELKEGQEFQLQSQPQANGPLLSPADWPARLAGVQRAWIWVDESTWAHEPLLQSWPVVARQNGLLVLRVDGGLARH